MRTLGFGSWAFGMALAIAFVAGCGGAQSAGPVGLPMSNAVTAQVSKHGHSWILTEAKSRDLIYAPGGCGGTCVLSYPKGKLVGELAYNGYAAFADKTGDVFISGKTNVLEFAHGGTTPIATYPVPYSPAVGCSVDPGTNSLAVVSGSDVEIFPAGSTNPISYDTLLDAHFCAYDNSGNLFVDGYDGQASGLSELAKGANGFVKLAVDQSVGQPGQVQWDGHYLSYESTGGGQPTITQLTVSGSITEIVGQTFLKRVPNHLAQSWVYRRSVIAPYSVTGPNAKSIGVWRYPKGGIPTKRIRHFGDLDKTHFSFSAVTISHAP